MSDEGSVPIDAEATPAKRKRLPLAAIIAIAAGVLVMAIVVTTVLVAIRPGQDADAAPAPNPTRSSTPTGVPTPTPTTAGTPPPIETLVLQENSLGDLRLGVDPATSDPATSVAVWKELDCGFDELVSGWDHNYADTAQHPFGLVVRPDQGLIAIQVSDSRILTAAGVGPGSTLDEIRAAYPGLQPLYTEWYMHRWGLNTGSGTLSFDFYLESASQGGSVTASSALITAAPSIDVLGSPSYHPLGLSCL